MNINIQLSGMNELQKKLKTLSDIERDTRIDRAVGRGAARIEAQVKMLTPVDTGNLRNKIFSEQEKIMEYHVGTNVEYALFVEFGTGQLGDPTVPHTDKDSWTYYSDKLKRFITTHGQEPAAMFRTGFEQSHEAAFAIFQREFEEIVKNG